MGTGFKKAAGFFATGGTETAALQYSASSLPYFFYIPARVPQHLFAPQNCPGIRGVLVTRTSVQLPRIVAFRSQPHA